MRLLVSPGTCHFQSRCKDSLIAHLISYFLCYFTLYFCGLTLGLSFEFTIIVNELFKILVNKRAHWLTLFKVDKRVLNCLINAFQGLAVLDFLLLNGSEDTIAECRGRMRDLEALLDFKYVDPEEDTDVGISGNYTSCTLHS